MNNDLISVFQDTQSRLWNNPKLYELTSQAIMCTRVFPEHFDTTRVVGGFSTGISVTEELTLQAAARMVQKYSKVAVLNFANAVNPGGGVAYGASAQEEDLCRCSNLYSCLTKPELFDSFYVYNNVLSPYFSDRVIYSPDVTVFKTDAPHYAYTDKWFQIDVITCPAPNLNSVYDPDYHKLEKIYCDRIRNILAVAEAHGVQALVLGAFGCGAYQNPPELMAKAFYKELTHGEYRNVFREIVFAIKADSPRGVHNLSVFRMILSPWQQNPLYGKRVSILGDSISTFWGSSPDGYRTYYNSDLCLRAGMFSVNDTWWKIVFDKLGGKLLVNNSYAGSCVTGNNNFAGSNDNRLYHLCNGYECPEVVLISMGMADFEQAVPVEPDDYTIISRENYHQYFRNAYQTMLWKIRQIFPNVEIYCATIKYGIYDGNTDFLRKNKRKGVPLKEYNRVIRECANEYGCYIVDIAELVKEYDTVDYVHPSAMGMRQLADGWMKAMNDRDGIYYFQDIEESTDWITIILTGIAVVLVLIILVLIYWLIRTW